MTSPARSEIGLLCDVDSAPGECESISTARNEHVPIAPVSQEI